MANVTQTTNSPLTNMPLHGKVQNHENRIFQTHSGAKFVVVEYETKKEIEDNLLCNKCNKIIAGRKTEHSQPQEKFIYQVLTSNNPENINTIVHIECRSDDETYQAADNTSHEKLQKILGNTDVICVTATEGTKCNSQVKLAELNKHNNQMHPIQETQGTPKYNGVLNWTLPAIKERLKQSRTGENRAIYSPPFYTCEGYKMCARLYLDGEGMGKKTHCSLFIAVMKGENDHRLNWPIGSHHKFQIALLSQKDNQHITNSFHGDPSSISFKRPTTGDRNIATGRPQFVAQETALTSPYLINDTMKFLINVTTVNKELYSPDQQKNILTGAEFKLDRTEE